MSGKDLVTSVTKILEHDPEAEIVAEHDQIWIGSVDKLPADVWAELEELGWFQDCESCSHFT